MKELPETTRQPFIPSQHHYHSFIFPSCHHDSTRTDYERRNSPTSYLFLSLFFLFSLHILYRRDPQTCLYPAVPFDLGMCKKKMCRVGYGDK